MRFRFNDRKTAQAAAYLLGLAGGKLNYMVLIKLLYLSDREKLLSRGIPITGDRMFSMKHGPVLSNVLDLISEGPPMGPSAWFEYIDKENYDVKLKTEAPTDELSRFDMKLLKRIFEQYGHVPPFALVEILHSLLPEWKDPGSSAIRIEPEDILRAEGRSEDDIQRLQAEAKGILYLDSLPA